MDLITMIMACSLYANNSIVNAIVQVGSKNNALAITQDGVDPKTFKTTDEALKYANSELEQKHPINIGLMQIPSYWLPKHHTTVAELLAPCKNIVMATQILNHAVSECTDLQAEQPNLDMDACTLSIYKTGDPQAGLDYAHTIMDYAQQHSFETLVAAAKLKNPKEFPNMPGHGTPAPTTASKTDKATTVAAEPNATPTDAVADTSAPTTVVANNDETKPDNTAPENTTTLPEQNPNVPN